MPSIRHLGIVTTIALLALVGPAAWSQDATGGKNVRITMRVERVVDGKPVPAKTYDLVVAAGSGGSQLLSGQRVPFPVKEERAGGESNGMHYVYQNVGFTVSAEVRMLGDGKVLLVAEIEDSRVVPGEGDAPPTVETRELNVSAILEHGKPLRLTEVQSATDPSGFVEVEARILE